MKELSIMEKAKAYDEALERAKSKIKNDKDHVLYEDDIIELFPELAESEDERIRKALINYLDSLDDDEIRYGISFKEMRVWLEKQEDKDKLIKVSEHQDGSMGFEVGDTITDGNSTFKVVGIEDGHYIADDGDKVCFYVAHRYYTPVKKQAEQKPTLPKWKYKKDNTPLLRDSLILNKYGCVAKSPSGALVSDVWVIDYDELAKLPKEEYEKQGDQDNNEDSNILQRFSFYSYKDEPNILYLSSLYVNEEYRNKGIGTKILEVADEVAKSLNCHAIRLKTKKDSDAERLYRTHGYNSLATEERDEIWLEKQGEQKSADKVKPKFEIEEGKWYVCTQTYTLRGKIVVIKGQTYKSNQDGAIEGEDGHLFIDKIDGKALNYFKPWTIKDAKDGDMIYVSTEEKGIQAIFYKYEGGIIYFYCNLCGDFIADGYMPIGAIEFVSPLQKVHYQRFFQKMHEAGYEWDADKKELRKIEQKPTWKPSDEQMEALERFIVYHNGSTNYAKDLEELRLQLKKLMEE